MFKQSRITTFETSQCNLRALLAGDYSIVGFSTPMIDTLLENVQVTSSVKLLLFFFHFLFAYFSQVTFLEICLQSEFFASLSFGPFSHFLGKGEHG